MNSRSGFSTLEFIVSSLLATVIVGAALSVFVTFSKQLIFIQKQTQQIKTSLEVRQLLSQGMRDLDTSTLQIAPRIQTGELKLTDGTPLVLTNIKHYPAMDSSVITFYDLDSSKIASITDRTASQVFLCSEFKTLNSPTDTIRSYLALTATGTIEVAIFPNPLATGCAWVTVAESKSMLINSLHLPATKHALKIIPILRTYSIYVDQDSTLRYLGHAGQRIIENQPMTRGIKSLTFSLEFNPILKLYLLRVNFQRKQQSEGTNWILSHNLARIAPFNLLLM